MHHNGSSVLKLLNFIYEELLQNLFILAIWNICIIQLFKQPFPAVSLGTSVQPEMERKLLIWCYSVDLDCLPKAHVLKA
jgi:hypothetical protein